MTNKKKVAIVFTGGTISMTVDEKVGAAIPTLSGEQIMSMVTNIDKVANVEVFNFDEIPGPHITPERMLELRDYVNNLLATDDISGVVITHGTDSLEETAYFLDLTIKTSKPVIVTGAMRSSSELGYDGPSNLSSAVCTAISEEAKDKGVLVVLNNEVMLASEATKTNTLSLNTFQALSGGPLGIIDCNELVLFKSTASRNIVHIDTDVVESKVALFKSGVGMDDTFIKFAADNGYKGIIVEAMGRGNIPPIMYEGVKYAREKGIPVVIVSRCHSGRVFDSYGYLGSGRDLRNIGCIFGGDLPGQKARIKLILALGKTNNLDEITDYFEKGIYY
ncbi:asparaginase [Romboutsia weinsteinii]|uniref:asparaginase n=1 Tax=Romboutsia weinsteinii TaxID=2020949 RepID=A0A371J8Z1_9FIRM|nr:asparaginase [Romboutsia weinsteinii]RDY29221.1 asparaginase [Romboutsia weinsteinii]